MIREEIRQLRTGPAELRKFGLLVGFAFAVLAAWLGWRGKAAYPFLAIPGGLLIVTGLFFPKGLRTVFIGWMSLAFVLGLVVSTLLLTLFFYFVLTPVGLVARLVGNDFLMRKFEPQSQSYWIMRKAPGRKSKESYEQQF
jgi:hypothetical protein